MNHKIKVVVDPDLAEFMPAYLKNRMSDYDKLKSFTELQDFVSIKIITHKIKGHAMSYGLAPLGEICRKIEVSADSGNTKEIILLLVEYKDYLDLLEL